MQAYGMTSSMGLVGYHSMGEERFNKPFSDETNWQIDEEIRNLVKEQYRLAKELLVEKKDKIEKLADRLLEKETINLPDIIEILGERPYGMNETMRNYLTEMQQAKERDLQSQQAEEQSDSEIVDS